MADLVITKGNIFKDGSIHSVWLQGTEQQIIARNRQLLDLTYQIQIGDLTLDLMLEQPKADSNKMNGALSSGEQEITLSNVSYHDQRLNFTAEMSDAGFKGINRFTLWFDSQGLRGHMLDKHNTLTPIAGMSVVRVIAPPLAEEKPLVTLISRLTRPNVAYGIEGTVESEKIHLSNDTLWTSDKQGVLEHAVLLISRGKIERIGHHLFTPSGYRFIDARGKHLTAGIIDEHSHIAINGGTNEGSDVIT